MVTPPAFTAALLAHGFKLQAELYTGFAVYHNPARDVYVQIHESQNTVGVWKPMHCTTDAVLVLLPLASATVADILSIEWRPIATAFTPEVPYTDVWTFPTVQAYAGKHPCEKPPALLEHIITASSRPDAVVLDAFAGSHSTGVAALRLGRRFVGIELSEHWHAQGAQALELVEAQPLLFAPPITQQQKAEQVKLW